MWLYATDANEKVV